MKNIFFKINFLEFFFRVTIVLLTIMNYNSLFSQTKRIIVEVNSQGPFFSSGYRTTVKQQLGINIFNYYFTTNQSLTKEKVLIDINDSYFPLKLICKGVPAIDISPYELCISPDILIDYTLSSYNSGAFIDASVCGGMTTIVPFYIPTPSIAPVGSCNLITLSATADVSKYLYSKTGLDQDWVGIPISNYNGNTLEFIPESLPDLINYSGNLYIKAVQIADDLYEYGILQPLKTFETLPVTYIIKPCSPQLIGPPTIVNNQCSDGTAGTATFTFDRDLATDEYFVMNIINANNPTQIISSPRAGNTGFPGEIPFLADRKFTIPIIPQGLAQGIYTLNYQTFIGNAITPASVGLNPPTFTITAPAPVTFTKTATNILCKDDSSGSITVNASGGGSGIYKYSKNGTANPQDIIWQDSNVFLGLVAGTYSILVKDSNGCIAPAGSQLVTLTEPATATTFTNVTTTDPLENNVSNGGISVTATGGTFPLTYKWVNTANPTVTIGTSYFISGQPAGNYSLTTTDANLCTHTESFTLLNPALLVPTITLLTPIRCNGESTAKLQASATGGIPNTIQPIYTYSWKKNGVTIFAQYPDYDTLINMGVGLYEVTVRDANAIIKTATYNLTQPNVLNATATGTAITPVSCNAGTDGAINLTVTGGTAPYTYLWSKIGDATFVKTTEDITGLTIGQYNCLVTDSQGINFPVSGGCTYQTPNFQITQPLPLSITEMVTPITGVGASDGGISVTVNGGTPNYTYLWTPDGEMTASISGKPAGTYKVTVTDSKGCSLPETYILNDPTPLTVALTQTGTILCNAANNGIALATTAGGQGPFTFQWTKNGVPFPQTTPIINNLSPGNYQVTVTGFPINASNTATSTVLTISQPNPITISETHTNVTCFGSATGQISVNVTDGTPAPTGPPYSFKWYKDSNPIVFSTSQSLTGLTAGSYAIYITGNASCLEKFLGDIIITQPASALTVIGTTTNPTGFGLSNGSINATVTGGTSPYTYSWSNGAVTEDLSGIPSGTYTLTVTDTKGCTTTITKTLVEPSLLTANLVVSSTINCLGGTGSLTATASGGTTPYTYIWKKGSAVVSLPNSTTTLTGQTAGNYTVIINDNAIPSNQVTQIITLTQPDLLTATATTINASCFGLANGSINLTISGGTSPYTTIWKDNLGTTVSTLEDPSGLLAGTYSCDITDAKGCTFSLTGVQITAPAVLNSTITISQPITAAGSSTGALTSSTTGGTLPYIYSWSNGAITPIITNIPAGTYTLTVTDTNGCSSTSTKVLDDLASLAVTISQEVLISCNLGNNGKLKANPVGGDGTYFYEWKKNAVLTSQITQFFNNATAGTYQVKVTDGFGNFISSTVFTVNEPTPISATTTTTDVNCFGGITGSINLIPSGGTAPYSYQWFNGTQISTAQNLVNVASGTYSVWIKDANNCGPTIINNLIINQPVSALSVVVMPTNLSGFGLSNGSVIASVSGGTSPYTYVWSSGQITQNLTAIPAGSYNVTVTDFKGCTITSSIAVVTEPNALAGTITLSTTILCNGGSGSITANPLGGSGGYTYLWSNGATSQTIIGISSGTYSVTIKDSNLNTTSATYILTQPTVVTTTYSTTPILCNSPGSITINSSGGSGTYTYLWNTGATTSTISVPSFATYNCTITDSNGCSILLNNIQPTQTSTLTIASVAYTPIIITGGTGGIDITVTGGTTPYTYLWSNGATSQDLTNVIAGNYTVTVTDASGCTQMVTYTLSPPIPLTVSISQQVSILCNGSNTAKITANPVGGQPTYTFVWKKNGVVIPLQTNAILNNIGAGNYEVTVTDANTTSSTSNIFVVSQPNILVATPTISNVNCFGAAMGGVSLLISGGTSPYSFIWKNSVATTVGTSQNLQNVISGIYSVTISDACSSITLNNIAITQPTQALSIGFLTSNPTGFGLNNGSINATISGGTAPYTYSWSSGQTTEDLTTIVAGTYTLTVTDFKGCQTNLSATLTQPNQMQTTVLVVNPISCNGDNNGVLIGNTLGGVSPFSYLWKKGTITVGTSQNITGLNAGNYTLIVTDFNGIQTTTNYNLTQPNVLTATFSKTPILCANGTDGSITIIPNGGTAPYSYQWSNGQISATINNVVAGSYVADITDSKGCTFTLLGMQITQPTPILVVSTVTPVLVAGASTGSVVNTITGGVSPFTYLWNSGETTKDILNKPAGTYTLVVTDANGCNKSVTFVIVQTSVLATSISAVQGLNCHGDTTGILKANSSGGVAPFTYIWKKNGLTISPVSQQVNNLSVGDYQVIITDSAGAVFTSQLFVLSEPAELVSNYLVASQTYKNEDIILINVSNNPNETYNWIVPNEATLISLTPQTIVMRFNQTGSFSMGLKTTNALGCQSITNKQIVVELNPGLPGTTTNLSLVKTFTLFPNPVASSAPFNAQVSLSQSEPISLTIYEAVLGTFLNQVDLPAATEHLQTYNMNLSSGVYWIILRTNSGVQAKKIIVY